MPHSDRLGEDVVVSFAVRHVWLGMRAVIEDELTEFGLTVPQFATLMMLENSPGLTVAEVARLCGTTRQSANEMVAGLEARGLVERAAHPKDRRAHQLHATEAGLEMFAKARPAVRRREDELEAGLSPEVREASREWMAAIAISCGLSAKK